MSWYSDGEKPSKWSLYHSGDADDEDFGYDEPISDVVKVVRCKDCKHSKPIDTKQAPFRYYRPECVMCFCEEAIGDEPMIYPPTHFCGYGERKGDENGPDPD
jgi:hypothetical protein